MNGWLSQARQALQTGDLRETERLCRDALAANGRDFDGHYLLAIVHMQRGEWLEAERSFGEAAKANPRSLDALYSRGVALQSLSRDEEALACFDKALLLRPGIPEIVNARGSALMALSRCSEALACFDLVLRTNPSSAGVWNNRANALAALGRQAEALSSYDKALALVPGHTGILNHRAITLFELKRYEEAARDFAAVLKSDPCHPYALGNLVQARRHCCDWLEHGEMLAALAARLRAGEDAMTPVQANALAETPEEQYIASRHWAEKKCPAAPPLWKGERYDHRKIRIAYLSADFHSHATAALIAGVFEAHDRGRFETYALSYGPDDGSPIRARLKNAADRFIDVREYTDAAIAKLLRQSEIDIAVDMKGYTQDARPGILAHRPAPVQASYLGFPGTMGAEYIDYFVADRIVAPPEQARWYAENLVYLPDSYQCNDSKREIAARTPARAEAGLPESGFVFCSFNNSYKIAPEIFAIWMRLLKAVEGSVLWLLDDNTAAVRNLRREAEAAGIAGARLVFAPRANLDYHLARHRLADVFLDTLPCGAHTTASDALWAGLPVVTCLGATFAGRVAASLLYAVNMPELITNTLADYEALALALAREPERLAALKAKLAANRTTAPLFDTARFTRNLEAAYRRMWERSQNGQPPESFAVPAPD